MALSANKEKINTVRFSVGLGGRDSWPNSSRYIALKEGSVIIQMPAQSVFAGGWVNFVVGPGVRAQVHHVKPDLVLHLVSVGRPGKYPYE